MPALTVTLIGFPEARARLAAIGDALAGRALVTSLQSAALLVQNDAARRAPVKTGNLRRSLHTEVLSSAPGYAAVAVGTNLRYARFVEFGTRAHTIYPRNGKALFWPGARHPVRSVRHPGTPARPYLIPALLENIGRIRDEIVASLSALLRRP